MKTSDSDLFFTCSLIELIGRATCQKRSAVVELLGRKVVSHIYANAGTLHCEPIAKTAETFIEMYKIQQGDFDNVSLCKYDVPSYWTIGKVYARLIEDVENGGLIETLFNVYSSPISDDISNFNSDFFYQPRDFIKEQFLNWEKTNRKKDGKKPSIRFRDFTDSWEQRKLGDYLETSDEKNVENTYSINDVLSVSGDYGVVNQIEFQGRSFAGASVSNYGILHFGDVVYTKSPLKANPYGIIKTNKGKTGIVSVLYGVYHPKENLHSDLVQTYFEQDSRLNDYLRPLVNKGAKNTLLISDEDALRGDVRLPSQKAEQQQICLLFRDLDRLITLHQRKLEKMSSIKKSMLEKMFPKNGKTIPEIRFSGFTDSWEQRKLGRIVERVVRKNTNNESMLPLTISAQYGLVDQISYFNNRVASRDITGYYLIIKGEFAYNKSTSDGFPFGAVKRLDFYPMGVLSTLYIVFSIRNPIETESDYLAVFFDTDRWHRGVSERAAEGARNHGLLNISSDDFFDIDLSLPKDRREQERIGQFFRQLDSLITLHQRKLEKLQNIKKSCLEKMFV